MHKLMKHKRIVLQLVFFSTIALGCSAAQAEAATLWLKAKVPFAFTVGSEQFSANTYLFIPPTGDEPGLLVKNPKEKTREMIVVESVNKNPVKPMKPLLVFDRIGGKDFLRQVWIEQKGYMINKSSEEQALEKKSSESQPYQVKGKYVLAQTNK